MNKQITSTQNSFIKELVQLKDKSRFRKKTQTFLIEGVREILLAIKGNYTINTILIDSSIAEEETLPLTINPLTEVIEISNEVYKKLALRDSTEGVLAIAQWKDTSLNALKLPKTNPLIIVAESLEKPGNIGALLRTADAANADAVFIANPKTDIYNPNIIRSSVGCIFTNQIATGTTSEIISFLKKNSINIYSTTLQNSNAYYKEDYTLASAIVVGTEATGLPEAWRIEAFKNINIPMSGEIDSLNVSVAAAIVIFEAKRQRNTKL